MAAEPPRRRLVRVLFHIYLAGGIKVRPGGRNFFEITTMNRILIKITAVLLAVAAMLALGSCGSDGVFRVNGRITDFGTGNLRLVYFDNGAVQNVTATAVDGKFAIDARVSSPVMVRLYTGNGHMLAAFNAAPGDNIEGTFSLADPTAVELKGNTEAERVARFLKANADAIKSGNHDSLNAAIAAYVRDNRDRLSSGTLLANYFHIPGHEAEMSELVALVGEKVARTASLRGVGDLVRRLAVPVDSVRIEAFTVADRNGKLITVDPRTSARSLLMFTDAGSRSSDSVLALLRGVSASSTPKVRIVDISADADTAAWLESLREIAKTDSLGRLLSVSRAWTPAPYAIMGLDGIAVAGVPWFVVADSTMRVLYRGPSAASARSIALTGKAPRR